MNCLCCNRKLNGNEENLLWHKSCLKKFFGTDKIPEINIEPEGILKAAVESTKKKNTVPGVQKKISLNIDENSDIPRLTMVDYPAGYILKPQSDEFSSLPELEHLTMLLAEITGIRTAAHALLKKEDKFAYITKRMDREGGKMYAMEDFCQISERLTSDKYKGSYEKCIKVIKDYSSRTMFDMSEFFLRILFCFITGNSDMHLKNFSLIEIKPGTRQFVLAPAYDLLPINLVMPEDKEQTALTLNGKKSKLKREDFVKLGEKADLSAKAINSMIKKIISLEEKYIECIDDFYLTEQVKNEMKILLNERISILRE